MSGGGFNIRGSDLCMHIYIYLCIKDCTGLLSRIMEKQMKKNIQHTMDIWLRAVDTRGRDQTIHVDPVAIFPFTINPKPYFFLCHPPHFSASFSRPSFPTVPNFGAHKIKQELRSLPNSPSTIAQRNHIVGR